MMKTEIEAAIVAAVKDLFDVDAQVGDFVIRRVDGETVRTFENQRPIGELLVPDAAGEVHQEFRDLALYLGYGIQWAPAH